MAQVDVHLKREVLSDLRAGASGKICRQKIAAGRYGTTGCSVQSCLGVSGHGKHGLCLLVTRPKFNHFFNLVFNFEIPRTGFMFLHFHFHFVCITPNNLAALLSILNNFCFANIN